MDWEQFTMGKKRFGIHSPQKRVIISTLSGPLFPGSAQSQQGTHNIPHPSFEFPPYQPFTFVFVLVPPQLGRINCMLPISPRNRCTNREVKVEGSF
ncbi:uncharacterized protein LACBIDRAFT_296911 [Laccaria bicolor S238N-H82]|uniref:Predicted protein n=1 Tax=Laccaria bicolor (strain S238N-H82 / ATCC MYA-4686) TaxID=486041 RepID=B0D9J6_LACBS|nr:uncharacterized protein LACBIDRAFT_297383 [Laccaria bicolor S238N-H82]XP_001880817.1 uncharacterized protein LACBIDRAFT_296911 [Laccaria bicolor S238N-H82]EDR08562.1 predicted protein [Laccaria bicolor S238N-H82]EDR08592.1 predicted protein [Laccaria bicolor S238N-H82]|eukprot:XP_001880787.1 predicted protein [Laccaria bicolor S238N-H82]